MVKKEQMYKGLVLGEERALYGLNGALVEECKFCGEEDGESALKECRDIDVRYCDFSLRYPLWHCEDFVLSDCRMSEGVRAPIWYSKRGRFERCEMYGVKALRVRGYYAVARYCRFYRVWLEMQRYLYRQQQYYGRVFPF